MRGGACLNKNKGRGGWLWDSKSGVGAWAGGGARSEGQLAAQPLRPARGRAPRGNALEVYSEGYRQKEWHKRGCGGGAAYCGRGDGCCGGWQSGRPMGVGEPSQASGQAACGALTPSGLTCACGGRCGACGAPAIREGGSGKGQAVSTRRGEQTRENVCFEESHTALLPACSTAAQRCFRRKCRHRAGCMLRNGTPTQPLPNSTAASAQLTFCLALESAAALICAILLLSA